ncbi:MAG: DUF1540 domain-containing protein [Clostridiales bacterium]|nr:DUF1540 domain-containing protein [Clostridiales bacterium]
MKTDNPSIKCSVSSCAYHSGSAGRCTLGEITVGCTQQNVADCKSTECASFQLGNHGTNCGCR